MEVCIQRDPSGLYAAAEGSGSADIPGLSFPYESPSLTHLELDTAELSLEDCLDRVIRLMESEAII
jgi:adenylylsulfate kinase-like enzyme